MIKIEHELSQLVSFALKSNLIDKEDVVYSINRCLDVLDLDAFSGEIDIENAPATPIESLEKILDWAFETGRLEDNTAVYRDLFESKLMDALTPRPSQVIRTFNQAYANNPESATEWYYAFSQKTNYIRMNRIAKNRKWKTSTKYGDLDITINLSKPEKDPKAIAAARSMPSSGYPKCLLCKENEGYAGRINHPGRHSHRIIPLDLEDERWFMQYSPYVYYNEHCIVLKDKHEPMCIGAKTFNRLLAFVETFPHYFIGSNADLPIVGGSILSHDHFQGGKYTFAMEEAQTRHSFQMRAYGDVQAEMLDWPMSVVRLRHKNKNVLAQAAGHVFETWKNHSDVDVDILAYSGDESHNTVTPIARFKKGQYEIDLVLRNNRTNEAHPLGIFHPHRDVHHIKKENIGLIEVMGLAVLPARLETELSQLARLWTGQESHVDLSVHLEWLESLKEKYDPGTEDEARKILELETGKKFMRVLEDAGVYKDNEEGKQAFERFVSAL